MGAVEFALGEIDQRSGDRVADQEPQCADSETHAHPRPYHRHVGCQLCDNGRDQRHECAREEAVEDAEDDDAGDVFDGDPAETQQARGECARKEHVQRAQLVGQKVWEDAAEGGSGVDDGQEVEGEVCGDWEEGEGVGLDVEEGEVEA